MDKYDGDVLYEVWRRGGNVDRIDFDRVDWRRDNGVEAEECAALELRAQRRARYAYPEEEEIRDSSGSGEAMR